MDLSKDQQEVLSAVETWRDRGSSAKQVLTFAGYAGTGKTTLVAEIARGVHGVIAFCAFTGKAASVLSRKLAAAGIPTIAKATRKDHSFETRAYCGTIHGLCYRPCERCMQDEQDAPTPTHCLAGNTGPDQECGEDKCTCVCATCRPPPSVAKKTPKETVSGPCPICRDSRYLRRTALDRAYELIIVDEASMVSDELLATLKSFGVPILAVGDHGQLPPVRGQGSLMAAPDLRLEKIHRQAEGNPIIALSARIRETGRIDDELEDGKTFVIESMRNLSRILGERFSPSRLDSTNMLHTAIIAATNRLRCSLNMSVREALGTNAGPPARGEVLVCLKNKPPVYNGMRAIVQDDARELAGGAKVVSPLLFPEDGVHQDLVAMCAAQFFAEKTLDMDTLREMKLTFASAGELYDFGYAMTCHKSQGSSFKDCIVVVDNLGWMSREDRTRWLYTSCTRASDRLTLVR